MFKFHKRILIYALIAILFFASGCYVGVVYSNGQNSTWDEVLGIFNVPWFNATIGLESPKYFIGDPLDVDNQDFIGMAIEGTAGESLLIGEVVYISSDGKYYKSDADSFSTMPVVALVLGDISVDTTGNLLLDGYFRYDSWSGWTIGGNNSIFASTDSGGITQTIPSGSGDQVQVIGYPVASKIIRFDPDSTVLEIN